MRVTMLTHIGGYRDGLEWPMPGGCIDVPDAEAADLIQAGYARATSDLLTGDLTPEQVRSLTVPPVELELLDKDELLAFAAKRDIVVSGRFGAEKLRELITEQLAATTTDNDPADVEPAPAEPVAVDFGPKETTNGDQDDRPVTEPEADPTAQADSGPVADNGPAPASDQGEAFTPTEGLDLEALDRGQLIEFAAAHNIEINKREGAVKIRAAIVEARV